MVTFDELKDARFAAMRAQADTWSRTMRQLDDIVRDFELGVCGATENAGWRGDAAGLANPELEAALRRVRVAALEARAVAAELDFAVDALSAAQTRLFGEMYAAMLDGVTVSGDGMWFKVAEAFPPSAPRGEQELAAAQAKLDGYVRRIQVILNDAADADRWHAAALAKLSPFEVSAGDAAALRHAHDDLRRTFSGLTPQHAAQWWASLTDAQRQAYLADFAHEIGGMDGLPATVRNQANQVALSERLADLAPLVAGGTATVSEQREYANLGKIQQVLAGNPARDPDTRLMLLKFGARNLDGEVVIAVGNPDTAKNTVVMVPGVNTTVSGKLGEQVARATNLQRAANSLTPTVAGDAAAIVWLDYDAPELSPTAFGSAAGPGRAQTGAPRLDRFLEGARAAGPADQHLTVAAHSYGSSVVAYAARDPEGLAADDIVFIGSPGVHADNVAQLRIDPDHVWVGLADADMVAPVGGFVHGRLPSDDAFGANVFPTNHGGHFSYWDVKQQGDHMVPDTSLESQARITMGQYP